MKIIHCSDLHLGSKMQGKFGVEKARIRRIELLDTFVRLCDFAVENHVEAILICGDVFDTKLSMNTVLKKQFLRAISTHENVYFFYVYGNHDNEAGGLDIQGERPTNLYDFSSEAWQQVIIQNVAILGRFCGKNCVADNLLDNFPVLDRTKTNIVLLHGQITDTNSTEIDEIPLAKLAGRGVDYIALGHIHSYKEGILDKRGRWCYCGCLEGRGFDECGDKGFVLLDIQNGEIRSKFISFAKRKIWEIDIVLSGCVNFEKTMDMIEQALKEVKQSDIVRVVLTGEIDESSNIECETCQIELSRRFFYVEVIDKTVIAVDWNLYKNTISLKGEFVRLVEKENISSEEKDKIIRCGLQALCNQKV